MEFSQNQPEIVILEYQNLPSPPPLDENLLAQIDTYIKGSNWKESVQCITMIRSIIKFYPQYTIDVMGKYGMVILEFLNNGKTQVLKNIFKLLKQIFGAGQGLNVEPIIDVFMPVLIKKSANELGIFKQMSQQVLTIISLHCGYNRTFQITIELSCDKNNQTAQLSIKLLAALLQTIGPNVTQLSPSSLQMLMRGISALVNGKRNNMKTSALDICMFLYNQIGSENFLQLMNYSLPQNEVMTVGQAMETHRTQKNKGVHLADVLKQRKSLQMQEQNNNNQMGNENWQNQHYR